MTEKQQPSDVQNARSNVTRGLPPIVRQVKENTLSILTNLLDEFFSSCDDLFFDLAGKAASNQEQNLYFDSMREIRIKKHKIQNLFKCEYEKSFLVLTDKTTHPSPSFNQALDSLELVEKDQAEQDVALSSIITRCRKDNQENLFHLQQRFDYLVPELSVTEHNSPLDPKQLCQAFANASRAADLDLKIRIIFYKQFDRVAVRKFNRIYAIANELMVNAGVLPDIRPTVKRSRYPNSQRTASAIANPGSTAPNNADGAARNEPSGQPKSVHQPTVATQKHTEGSLSANTIAFDTLSDLLSQISANENSYLPFNTAGSSEPPISSEELLEALDHISRFHRFDYSKPQGSEPLRKVVKQILVPASGRTIRKSLQKNDEDTINLVALFFDYILDDKNLPVAIQALIARLQIPVLKTALTDKAFFNTPDHPARLLINKIANHAIGWSEEGNPKEDPFYQLVNSIVQEIHNHHAGKPDIFVHELKRLDRHLAQDAKRTALVEKRTTQAAIGRAKALQTKKMVQKVLWNRVHEQQLPHFVAKFIALYWQKVLNFVMLRHGQESAEWVDAVQVVDDLIWAFQPHRDTKSRERVTRITPRLIVRIHTGLKRMGTIPRPALLMLNEIKDQLKLIKENAPLAISPTLTDAHRLSELAPLEPENHKTWDQMTAVERQQHKLQAATYEYLQKAEGLKSGEWFMLSDPGTGRMTRCKLSSRVLDGEQFVFVSRMGFRVTEKSKREVASLLQRGLLLPLDTRQLFDRAMNNITANLKKRIA